MASRPHCAVLFLSIVSLRGKNTPISNCALACFASRALLQPQTSRDTLVYVCSRRVIHPHLSSSMMCCVYVVWWLVRLCVSVVITFGLMLTLSGSGERLAGYRFFFVCYSSLVTSL